MTSPTSTGPWTDVVGDVGMKNGSFAGFLARHDRNALSLQGAGSVRLLGLTPVALVVAVDV